MVRKPIWRIFTISSMKQHSVMVSHITVSPTTNTSLKLSKRIMQEDFSSPKKMEYFMQLVFLPTLRRQLFTTMVRLRVTEKSVAIWLPTSCSGSLFKKASNEAVKNTIFSVFLRMTQESWPVSRNLSSDLIQKRYTSLRK